MASTCAVTRQVRLVGNKRPLEGEELANKPILNPRQACSQRGQPLKIEERSEVSTLSEPTAHDTRTRQFHIAAQRRRHRDLEE